MTSAKPYLTEGQLEQIREDWMLFVMCGDGAIEARGYATADPYAWYWKKHGNLTVEMCQSVTNGLTGRSDCGISYPGASWFPNFQMFEERLRAEVIICQRESTPASKSKS